MVELSLKAGSLTRNHTSFGRSSGLLRDSSTTEKKKLVVSEEHGMLVWDVAFIIAKLGLRRKTDLEEPGEDDDDGARR